MADCNLCDDISASANFEETQSRRAAELATEREQLVYGQLHDPAAVRMRGIAASCPSAGGLCADPAGGIARPMGLARGDFKQTAGAVAARFPSLDGSNGHDRTMRTSFQDPTFLKRK